MKDLIVAMSKIDNINSQRFVVHLLELQKQLGVNPLGVNGDIMAFDYLYNEWDTTPRARIDLIIDYISSVIIAV